MPTIELITPVYNESSCINLFYEEVKRVFTKELPEYRYIITYVDDGSRDDTLEAIKEMVKTHPEEEIRYLSFSRNFGKESAMCAGLANCVGDYVVVLDVDLQHPPALIPQMLQAVTEEGYDCATARRVSHKGEPPVRSFFSRRFYRVFSWVTGIELLSGSTDFRLMKRNVAQVIASMPERERFTKGIYSWIGFRNKWVEYENVERAAGVSKWNIKGLVRYSYHGFIAFATTPLRAAVWLGAFITAADVIWVIKILLDYCLKRKAAGGGITTLTLITLFLGGVVIIILGLIGEYLARIYLEVKQRPLYIVRDSNTDEKDINYYTGQRN